MNKHRLANSIVLTLLLMLLISSTASAQELVRVIRMKLSAGDLLSGAAAAEEHKRSKGVDAEYLDGVARLARGAELLKQYDTAAQYVAELRREIPNEKAELLSAFGAVIEVEARLRAMRDGRGAALRFLEAEFARAKAVSLRSRIRKNINLLSLEGQAAPEFSLTDVVGPAPRPLADYKGKAVLLFLWAHWCGDCKAQSVTLARIWQKYRAQGLVVLAPTRYYGTGAENKTASPAEEKMHVAKVWQELYAGLADVPIIIDTETMVRYGASATPTFALIDRKGIVRFYSPTRMSEAELTRRIEAVLAETP